MNKRRRYKSKARRRTARLLARWRRARNTFWNRDGTHTISEADVKELQAWLLRSPRHLVVMQ